MQPTPITRQDAYERDSNRCIRCGLFDPLTIQHRKAVGMGGSQKRPEIHEIVTACAVCNERFERDLQTVALLRGWKVKIAGAEALVPVYYQWKGVWAILLPQGGFRTVTPSRAEHLLREVYGADLYNTWTARLRASEGRRT